MIADPAGRSLVLAIGLDGYQALPKLVGASRGADAIARLLWRRYGFEASVLTDQQATRGAVNRELERLALIGSPLAIQAGDSPQPIDSVVIYYAGRVINDNTLALYNANPDIPATGLEVARLFRVLNSLTARHALLILDAPIPAGIELPAMSQPDSDAPSADRSRTILCAGEQAWRSRDLWSDNDTSLFTAQIIFGLMGNAGDDHGRITLNGLIEYVSADMQRVSNGHWQPWSRTMPAIAAEWVIQAETPPTLPDALTNGLRSGFPSLRNQALGDIAHLIERGTLAQKALAIAKLRETAAESDLLATRKAATDELLARNIPVEEEHLPPWREPLPERPGANPLPPPSEQAAPPMPGDRRSTIITVLIAIGVLATTVFIILHFSP